MDIDMNYVDLFFWEHFTCEWFSAPLPKAKCHIFLQYFKGFSKPFILNVFDEESESALEEPVIQWGDMVKQTKLIKQGEKVTNIAVCYQKATGSPSGLQFGFK